MNWLGKLGFGRSGGWTEPIIPDGLRVYAIGDIHGRFDLLEKIAEQIRQDLIDRPARQSVEIFLGDYVDRGPNSRAVLDFLSAGQSVCDRRICLKGNHEDILLNFLDNPAVLEHWRDLGGLETMYSYGVQPPRSRDLDEAIGCRDGLLAAMPESHLDFIRSMPLHIEVGSYLFVHAGLRPGRPLDDQDEEDLLWIRGAFLDSKKDHGCIVVHGHTPQQDVEILPNRINADTWAYLSGRLSCVVLESDDKRLIQASI